MSKNNFFGEEIKRIRNAKKMTINELSEKSSVSSSYISQIENGKRDTPTPDLIKKLSYGLSTDYYNLMRIAGYLNHEEEENEFVTLDQIMKKVPNEEKIKDIIKNEDKNKVREDTNFAKFLNKIRKENIEGFRNYSQEELDSTFKVFLVSSGSVGHYLKILRLFNEISQKQMAKLLQLDAETYISLEETLKENSPYLIENSEKLGKILNVSDFLTWYKYTKKQNRFSYILNSNKDSLYKQICLDVKAIEKKVNKSGQEYYVEYSHEELKRNLFDLDHLLNQKEHKVIYKDKVLTEEEIEKIKTMLNVIFD